eukprot:g19384.t1
MQAPVADPDFRQEVLVDFQRTYGAGSALSCPTALHSDLAVEEALEHTTCKPHCKEVYKSKNFLWMERLAKWALELCPDIKHRKAEALSFFDKVKAGLVTEGEITPSGFWRFLPEADTLAKISAAQAEAKTRPAQKPREHWASEDQIKEMWRQTEGMIAKGLWERVDISTAPKPIRASKCFPVEQGKTRLCVDYRRQSLLLYNSEKMRMLGTRACQEIICRLLSPYAKQPALRQFKSDTKADVAAERANRERTKAAAVGEVTERVKADLDFLRAMPDYKADRRDHTLTSEDSFGFVPYSSTKDMSGYYYQYCVDSPEKNLLWMPLPRKPGCNKPRSWMLLKSKVALFGSLSSVCECVHGSELIQLISNAFCLMPTAMYIDDLHSHSRGQCVEADASLVALFCILGGWDEAGPKRAMHKLPLARSLVQLGIAYELSADAAFLSLSIDPSRIEKLMERGREMIASLTPPARVSREALESFKGLFRHCTQLSPQLSHLVRPLDKWTDEDFFSRHIRDDKQRRALKTTLLLLLSCVPHAQTMVMRAADFDLPFVHIYTDASLDNVRELNAVLGRGQRRNLERFNIFIGGMLVRQDGTSEAFRTQLTRLPPDSDSCHIGVIETLAVRAAASVFHYFPNTVFLPFDQSAALRAFLWSI